jgi:hypothetical protein
VIGCVTLVSVFIVQGNDQGPQAFGIDAQTAGNVLDSCVNPCHEFRCDNGGICVNLFNRAVCDCFGTEFEGDRCQYGT